MNWNKKYQEENTPWDLGRHSKLFEYLLDQYPPEENSTGLVLGSGRGHDVNYISQHINQITGIDLSELATEYAQENYSSSNTSFICDNIFNIKDKYNYIFEHTCFCAIPVEQRQDYVELVYNSLEPDGKLYAIFWCHDKDGGPPFGTHPLEVIDLFSHHFTIELLEPGPSEYIEREAEYVAILEKKA